MRRAPLRMRHRRLLSSECAPRDRPRQDESGTVRMRPSSMASPPSARAAGAAGWLVAAVLLLLGAGGAASRPGGWLLGMPGVLIVALAGGGALIVWRAGLAAGAWALGLAVIPLL